MKRASFSLGNRLTRAILELLRKHVLLDLVYADCGYLNRYILALPSNCLISQIEPFTEKGIKWIMHIPKGEHKDDVATGYPRQLTKSVGMIFIVRSQEKMTGWKAWKETHGKFMRFQSSQQSVVVRWYCYQLNGYLVDTRLETRIIM